MSDPRKWGRLGLGLWLTLGAANPVQAQAPTPSENPCPALVRRLEELALHWKQLPALGVAYSGRSPEQILGQASPQEQQRVGSDLALLLAKDGAERDAALIQWLAAAPARWAFSISCC